MPQLAHIINDKPTDPDEASTLPGDMKIPDPIIEPITSPIPLTAGHRWVFTHLEVKKRSNMEFMMTRTGQVPNSTNHLTFAHFLSAI